MKHEVVYKGMRGPSGCLVTCDGRELNPRNDLRNHSPTGFEWGYNGNGTAQLALAILCDCLGDDSKALEYYQEFKMDILSSIAQPTWTLKSETIVEWTRRRMKERRDAVKGNTY